MENNYISVTYNEKERPKTKYPQQLVQHLIKKFDIKKDSILLDTGSGRLEFLESFENEGLTCYGIDLDVYDNKKIFKVNLETEKLPFDDNTFDVVYSKSMLEHIHRPQSYMKEVLRVLKPEGKFIVLVPNWLTSIYLYFYDSDHKQPYTEAALSDLLKISGFKDVQTEEFFQLPILWKYPVLKIVSKFLQIFGCPKRIVKNKFIRWSRETMVLGSCKK